MTDPLEHIRFLAEKVGPRPATSLAERHAANYIAGQLESFGYVTKQENFRSVRTFGEVYGVIYALALLGFVGAGAGEPRFAFLLTGIALVAFIGENTTALRLASTLIPRGKSQNVVGRLVPGELPRRRLVIAAHYDTTKSGLMFAPGMVRWFRPLFLASALCLVALFVLTAAEALTRNHVFFYYAFPFTFYLMFALALLVHREFAYKHVVGANDNASGVAVALSLAEALSQDAPTDTEILVVATGSEEPGQFGMESFLRRHADEVTRSWIINIDNVGAGNIHYVESEGMLLRHGAGVEVLKVADQVARLPSLAVTPVQFHAVSTDAEPALLRNLDAITIIGLRDGLPVNYHWSSDTFQNIDPDAVDTSYRFVEQMVRRLIV